MASNSCLDFLLGDSCWHGNCANSTCVCHSGYSNSPEFLYFVENINENVCAYQENAIHILYIFACTTSFLALLMYLFLAKYRADTATKLLRILPSLLSLLLCCISSVYRLVKEDAYFGQDIWFTFLIVNANALTAVAIATYLMKYMHYMTVKNDWVSDVVRKHVKTFEKTQKRAMTADLLMWNLVGASVFSQGMQALIIVRVGFGLALLRVFYMLYYCQIFIGTYISDLAEMKNLKDQSAKIFKTDVKNTAIYSWIQIQLPRAKRFRFFANLYGVVEFLYCLFPLGNMSLFWMSYFIPVSLIMWSFLSLITVFLGFRNRLRRKLQLRKLSAIRSSVKKYSATNTSQPPVQRLGDRPSTSIHPWQEV
mmetsp:Transcript_2605/g.2946  ORF Transcript_2605/g.2946 Transcript_2605/m.2946 type:complete len:366 (+) Transcript_2605:209-1306(+)